ncbi:hypothetical protein NQ314_016835 [Rhamnusium bicolor]|uniref:Major facilitator superfamily (MFS) profile domain-containing protein n=1 Tax=Rhamnusium bicolor TaxID=1586634 RepID=A0AAV8WXM5_9CUCU|nr:hypothetical protein NQ314_016835 [Rhamnusium bicolor]
MHMGWPSTYVPVLVEGNYTFQITSEEGSWLTVMPLIGAIIGAFLTGLIVNMFGRKTLIVFSSLPFIASWLLVAFAKSSALMFVGRFLAGTADGLSFTIIPMYLGEIAEPKIRGLLGSIFPVTIILGLLLINILGAFLPLDTAAHISVVVPVLLLIIFPWMPESPYFYLMKGNMAEARKSLQTFRGVENVSVELERVSNELEKLKQTEGSVFQLFTVKSNRKGMIITLGLRGLQQLSGTTTIIYYANTIFNESKGFISPSFSTIIYFTVQLFFAVIASFTVDFSGRRPLLIISTVGTALSLFVNGVYFYLKKCTNVDTTEADFIPIAALLCFVVLFSIGLQTIPILILGEIFSTDVKGFALSLVDIYASVVGTIVAKYFHWTNEAYGMHVPFLTFASCCIIGLFFIIFYVPETKGKTLEDIQMELREKSKVRYARRTEETRLY